jgi:hypothetical protein
MGKRRLRERSEVFADRSALERRRHQHAVAVVRGDRRHRAIPEGADIRALLWMPLVLEAPSSALTTRNKLVSSRSTRNAKSHYATSALGHRGWHDRGSIRSENRPRIVPAIAL